jgi:hypothetical protein
MWHATINIKAIYFFAVCKIKQIMFSVHQTSKCFEAIGVNRT